MASAVQQDARIKTHAIVYSPGGTPMVEVGRGGNKVVSVQELNVAKAEKSGAKSFIGSRLGKPRASPHRAALTPLNSNADSTAASPSPAKARPRGCSSQSPLGSPKVSPHRNAPLEERYGHGPLESRPAVSIGMPPKKTKKFGLLGRKRRKGPQITQDEGAALARAAMERKDPLRQSFLHRTIEDQQKQLQMVQAAADAKMEQLRRHYEEEMAANTQKIEEEAKRKAAEELAQASADAEAGDGQEDFDLDAEIEAAQRDDAGPQDAADGAGEAEQQAEGIENYADPVRNAL